jgi:hypothetical protein
MYVLYSTSLNIRSEKLAYLNHNNCFHKDVGFYNYYYYVFEALCTINHSALHFTKSPLASISSKNLSKLVPPSSKETQK